MKPAFAALGRAIVLAAGAVAAVPCSAQTATSFQNCLAQIRVVSTKLGVAPVNIVETSRLRMVRYPTRNGSVIVTCSARAPYMAVTASKKKCGVDVKC